MKFENGIHAITNEQYHSSEGISRSDLMRFKKSPMHFKHKPITEETEALIIGELVHTLVLEPELFDIKFVLKPALDKLPTEVRLKDVGKEQFEAYKAQRKFIQDNNKRIMDEFELTSVGKRVIESNHYAKAKTYADAVNNHMFKQYLSQGYRVENSIFFRHELTGLQCKVRPDAWLGDIVIDLKTSADASFRAFQSSAVTNGYYLQAGMIKRALESLNKPLKNFIFVVVEKKEPYAIGIYKLDDEALEYGANEFDTLMVELDKYIQKDEFPDYGIQTLSIPAWLKTE